MITNKFQVIQAANEWSPFVTLELRFFQNNDHVFFSVIWLVCVYSWCFGNSIPSVLRTGCSISLDFFIFLVQSECCWMRVRKMAAAVELWTHVKSAMLSRSARTSWRELTNATTAGYLHSCEIYYFLLKNSCELKAWICGLPFLELQH